MRQSITEMLDEVRSGADDVCTSGPPIACFGLASPTTGGGLTVGWDLVAA